MINDLQIQLSNLLNIFDSIIPQEIDSIIDIDGRKFHVSKKDGNITIEEEDTVDDVKEVIKEYKENLEELDDTIFIKAVSDMEKSIDVTKFNSLLEKERFTKDEAEEVLELIEFSKDIISKHIKNEIEKLCKLFTKF